MANNKKKLMTTIIAASMAAALVLGGGSYAYLQSQSGTVTNRFQTNQVMVSLSETGSTQYNIIPGVNDTKDPTVTLNNTIDAFVVACQAKTKKLPSKNKKTSSSNLHKNTFFKRSTNNRKTPFNCHIKKQKPIKQRNYRFARWAFIS